MPGKSLETEKFRKIKFVPFKIQSPTAWGLILQRFVNFDFRPF